MSMIAAMLAAFALSQAAPEPEQAAAPPQEDAQATQLDDILVEGQRLEQAARAFIEEVGEPPRGTRPARWNRNLCISVSNLRADLAQFMIDRIAMAALDAGADVDGPGCRPNVIILGTDNGPQMATELVRGARLGFRPTSGSTNLGAQALERFQTSDAAVRWWHVTLPTLADTGEVVIREPNEPRTVTVRDGSRMRSNIRYDLGWVVIVVDMSRTNGVSFGALSDYVAMVTLAQVDPTVAAPPRSSILTLFSDPEGTSSLTDWDKDYLRALYEVPPNRANSHQQESMMARNMIRNRLDGLREEEAPADGSADERGN